MKKILVLFVVCLTLFNSAVLFAEELLIYSGRKAQFIEPVIEEFTRTTGIKVKLRSGNSTYMLNLMSMQLDSTLADIYISNDAGNLERGNLLGLFQTLPFALVKNIPKTMRADNHHWVGLSGRSRVLVVNTKSPLATKINSIQDLAKPEMKDRLAITRSENESFIAGVTVYMRSLGEQKVLQWLKAVKANIGDKVYKKHSAIVSAVAKGEKDVGLVNHYYAYRYLEKNPQAPIKVILPDRNDGDIGVAWNVSGAAISRYSKKSDVAVKFLEFLLSAKGQKMFANANHEYPVRQGVPATSGIPAINSYNIAKIKMSDIGLYRDDTIRLFNLITMP